MTIVEFLEARADEVEQVAKEADPGPWRIDEHRRNVVRPAALFDWVGVAGHREDVPLFTGQTSNRGQRPYKDAAHIVRHDPVRVLREVEAKREIVNVHSGPHSCGVSDYDDDDPCPTLRLLAFPDHDHPDHDPAWMVF